MNQAQKEPARDTDLMEPTSRHIPVSLHQLEQMQRMAIAGCSDKEIDEACRPKPWTEEERRFMLWAECREADRKLRKWDREQRKLQENEVRSSILKKLGMGP